MLRQKASAAGLELEAIENLDPGHWYDMLLNGPKKREQLENVKTAGRQVAYSDDRLQLQHNRRLRPGERAARGEAVGVGEWTGH